MDAARLLRLVSNKAFIQMRHDALKADFMADVGGLKRQRAFVAAVEKEHKRRVRAISREKK